MKVWTEGFQHFPDRAPSSLKSCATWRIVSRVTRRCPGIYCIQIAFRFVMSCDVLQFVLAPSPSPSTAQQARRRSIIYTCRDRDNTRSLGLATNCRCIWMIAALGWLRTTLDTIRVALSTGSACDRSAGEKCSDRSESSTSSGKRIITSPV